MSNLQFTILLPTRAGFNYPQWLGRGSWLVLLFVLCVGLAILSGHYAGTSEQLQGRKLHQYSLSGGPFSLMGVSKNASGLTYNRDTGTLFAVINAPEQLLELDTDGNVLRTIPLAGFEDTEGVAHIGNNHFAIIEERRRGVVLVEVTAQTTQLDLAGQRRLSLPSGDRNNNGFEGLAADRANDRLFIVSEKNPRQLWQIDGFTGAGGSLILSTPLDVEKNNIGNRDLSGVYFDDVHQNLLLLSDESKLLTEINLRGTVISRMQLQDGVSGLSEDIPQPEGVTLDDRGFLYILSEPNLLFRFEPRRDNTAFAQN